MARKLKLNTVYLAVAVLAVIVVAFLMFSGASTGKFYGVSDYGVLSKPPIQPPLRTVYNNYLCCANPFLGDMQIANVNVRAATVDEMTICSERGKPAVKITYDTNQPTPAYITYKKSGDSDANIKSHSDYCQPKTHQLVLCNLDAHTTYEYRLHADTHAAKAACAPTTVDTIVDYPSPTTWKTFRTP